MSLHTLQSSCSWTSPCALYSCQLLKETLEAVHHNLQSLNAIQPFQERVSELGDVAAPKSAAPKHNINQSQHSYQC